MVLCVEFCTKEFPQYCAPNLCLLVNSYGFCRYFSLQTAGRFAVNFLKFPAEGNADEDQKSCPFLHTMAPMQS